MFFRYSTLSDSDLLRLPVGELCATDGLVVLWVTNKLRQQRFVKDHLFPCWNVTYLAEWYWLKVDHSLCVALLELETWLMIAQYIGINNK